MYCSNCGAEVKEDTKFCPNCGTNVNESKQTKSNANSSITENKTKNNTISNFLEDWKDWSAGKKVISIILVCCIGLIIIGAIGGFLFPDLNTHGSLSNHKNIYPSSNSNNDYEDRYDSYTGGSSSKEVNNVEVDKTELTRDQYSLLAYDGTKDYTMNGQKGLLYVGPYHDGGSDVNFFYKKDGKFYMLSACDDSEKAIEKMKTMV